jgi:hypothetical protein
MATGAGAAAAGSCAGTMGGAPGLITIVYATGPAGIPQLAGANVITLEPSVGGGVLAAVPGNVDWGCASATGTTAGTNGVPFTLAVPPVLGKYAPTQCK